MLLVLNIIFLLMIVYLVSFIYVVIFQNLDYWEKLKKEKGGAENENRY